MLGKGWWPSEYPLPGPEYERVSWSEVKPGDEVYLMYLCPPNNEGKVTGTWAKGPYKVVTSEPQQLLVSIDGGKETINYAGERLLKKKTYEHDLQNNA